MVGLTVVGSEAGGRDRQDRGRVIRLRGVSKVYEGSVATTPVLKRVSLDVEAGEFVAVVGKSGSGKSTLANLLTGVDAPTEGEVVVCGTDLTVLGENAMAAWRRRHLGVVFQFFQLLPTLTLLENVMLPMELARSGSRRERRARALALLARFGLDPLADRLPSSTSGGQQQRAAIARALANQPRLVVADEPTGSLDSHAAAVVFDLFKTLSSAGTTIVMVTHDRDLARQASRVVLLVDGEVMDAYLRSALPGLSQQELAAVAAQVETTTLAPGEELQRHQSPAEVLVIPVRGSIEFWAEASPRGPFQVGACRAGESYLDLGAEQDGQALTTRAGATSDSVALVCDCSLLDAGLAARLADVVGTVVGPPPPLAEAPALARAR